jgi:hypothetical protein
LAVINGYTFELGEEGEINLGAREVTICCRQIDEDSAVVEFTGTGQRQTLKLKPRGQSDSNEPRSQSSLQVSAKMKTIRTKRKAAKK